MKIAVFINDYNQILPFYSSGIVEIYSDDASKWECINQIPFDMTFQRDLADVQLKINMLTSEFEDCNLLIVENIKGLPTALLQEKGIGIWKFSGLFLPELLDFVQKELTKALVKPEVVTVRPILIGREQDAEYEIDLAAILEESSGLNSMDILIPFMKETSFRKLRIKCTHLPKWFNKVIEAFQLVSELEKIESELFIATVKPAVWGEDISFRQCVHIPGMGGGCSSGGC
ncbi:Nitrogenase iron-iron accessory protein AnfO [Paludibacter propionicigenes WB4]|uniref:Nitrogenase iron-iron accessory protein AnfO n=1 Tax=Paludibacter propionicigenes (strain DSM 17365 / JCM 13257 / WB4) TaxID=694427 RepID=E4T460_PALPW|nr:Fe-only nitrogenase accessory AnfO family protein [Paludibacter propionicigenes]ADQ79504.1 Nitrogenase iron-iron accessory protein AnfO [Paludibacter propionicigenes WB4]